MEFMQLTPMRSSVIESIGHNGLRMRIRFHSGDVVDFDRVPLNLYWGMIAAKSPGKYFAENIKGLFAETAIPQE
jgi:hypothetical protein